MSEQKQKISRRDFLAAAWGAVGAVALAESVFVGLKFFAPRVVEGKFGGLFNVGQAEQYPPGSVTPYNEGRFYLVRLMDGGFLALYRRCTHLGCSVPYDPVSGQFVCPCHGSAFTTDGQVLTPPAPRPLDQFPLAIMAEGIAVDTGSPIERNPSDPAQVVYI